MFKVKVLKIEKATSMVDNSNYLDVNAAILDSKGKVVEEKRLAFPYNTTKEELAEQLQKIAETYTLEVEQAEANAEREEAEKNADSLIEDFEGEVLSPEKEEKEEEDEE